jgi:hypothetical protein
MLDPVPVIIRVPLELADAAPIKKDPTNKGMAKIKI